MKKPVLVVMAAGMGSRYGGLKQIDPVGSCGEAILDYSLFDAHEAGFETAVIIIKEAIREDFMATVGKRLEKCPMQIRYAYQEQTMYMPEDICVPPERGMKPWGTGHAVLCATEQVDGAPFVVINADDYYGKTAFRVIYEALCNAREDGVYDFSMVSYYLGNTVTEHGSVARGVCTVDADGNLSKVVERLRIEKYPQGIHFTVDGETWEDLPEQTPVSMNTWGFTPVFLDELAARFQVFLREEMPQNPAKKEYQLPTVVSQLLDEGKATVKVLSSPDKWYGVTYAEDKPQVVNALREKTRQGLYPEGLWK